MFSRKSDFTNYSSAFSIQLQRRIVELSKSKTTTWDLSNMEITDNDALLIAKQLYLDEFKHVKVNIM